MWTGLVVLASVGAGLLARSAYERKHFTTETFVIQSKRLQKSERRYIFLSDLHNQTFGQNQETLLKAIRQIKPDGILIGGDMMVCKGEREIETALFLVETLARSYPVYYGNGNHENRMNREREIYGDLYDRFLGRLKKAGVFHLSNQSAWVDSDIRITGLDLDPAFYRKFQVPKMHASYIRHKVGPADQKAFQILLAHSPLYGDAYDSWGADLTLSGHFHGGTIRIPGVGGVMTPQFQFFLPWCGGLFQRGRHHMVVSRGLGTHSVNIRLNNRPHLVVLSLRNPYLH